MSHGDAPKRLIVLKTLYHTPVDHGRHYYVTSYKTEAKGEEHYGGCISCVAYDLKEMFCNRVITLSGDGTHIPLVNSRIMLSVKDMSVDLSRVVNPYPFTTDYNNPHKSNENRESKAKSRLSVGACSLINFTPDWRSSVPIDPETLTAIYADGLEPAPRRELSKGPQANKKENSKREEGQKTGALKNKKAQGNASDKPDKPIARKPSDASISSTAVSDEVKQPNVLAKFEWSASSKDVTDEESFIEKKKIAIRSMLNRCKQNNLSYRVSSFQDIQNARAAEARLHEAMRNSFASSGACLNEFYHTDKIHQGYIVLVTQGAKIVGMAPPFPGVRGVELVANELAVTLVDDMVE